MGSIDKNGIHKPQMPPNVLADAERALVAPLAAASARVVRAVAPMLASPPGACSTGDWRTLTGCRLTASSEFRGRLLLSGSPTNNDSANPFHTSACWRSRQLMWDVRSFLTSRSSGVDMWALDEGLGPRRVLSFGCSIGFEAVEAQAHFPHAEVHAYDLDADIVRLAQQQHGNHTNCAGAPIAFTSNRSWLLLGGYDLVLCNHVLYGHMEPPQFRALLSLLVSLLSPRGTLELMVYDEDAMQHCQAHPPPESWAARLPLLTRLAERRLASMCSDYNFTQQLAVQGLQEHFGDACTVYEAFPWVAKLHLCPAAQLRAQRM